MRHRSLLSSSFKNLWLLGTKVPNGNCAPDVGRLTDVGTLLLYRSKSKLSD